jgi:hypothetical protein
VGEGLDPGEAGEESLRRIGRFCTSLSGELASGAQLLLARHRYAVDAGGGGPHRNVLGHPLFELPIWVDNAVAGGPLSRDVILDICEASLCGYLSVRAEDDYFDGEIDDAGTTMMVAGVFRTRHQALMASLLSDPRFWRRFEEAWFGYAAAMLLERRLHRASEGLADEEFDRVLDRSQPLELPAAAVLALKGKWHLRPEVGAMVRHLTKATQLLDDFIDAPEDLARGNHTLMVRRLGGDEGDVVLRRNMVAWCDRVRAEADVELDAAARIAGSLGIVEIIPWVEKRRRLTEEAARRMFEALFARLNNRSQGPAALPTI